MSAGGVSEIAANRYVRLDPSGRPGVASLVRATIDLGTTDVLVGVWREALLF
jgi:hypothetical protein